MSKMRKVLIEVLVPDDTGADSSLDMAGVSEGVHILLTGISWLAQNTPYPMTFNIDEVDEQPLPTPITVRSLHAALDAGEGPAEASTPSMRQHLTALKADFLTYFRAVRVDVKKMAATDPVGLGQKAEIIALSSPVMAAPSDAEIISEPSKVLTDDNIVMQLPGGGYFTLPKKRSN